jgi:hypothetical protein
VVKGNSEATPPEPLNYSHTRCLRDYPNSGEGVITLAGVEHCFMYVVQNDVVETVIGPLDYIEQVFNERRQNM